METKIVFQTEKKEIQDFVKHSPGDFAITYVDNELQVIVKEVKEKKQTYEKVRMIAGGIARQLTKRKIETAYVNNVDVKNAFSSLDENKVVIAFVEGWHLGTYVFDTYQSKKSAEATKLTFKGAVDSLVATGKTRAEATAFSRDLMNEIPSTLNPETFPEILKEQFAQSNVEIVVHDKAKLEEMEMNGLLAVNRGSKFDPAFIELHYKGDESKPLIALVGKGVTFDTGGISLKSGRDLSDMRMDMGGAAAVAGAIKLRSEERRVGKGCRSEQRE